MPEKAKVPAIRFKGFNNAWEQRKFGDMADYKKGPFGSALKKEIFVPKSKNSIKVYEQQNAINKDWMLERYFITKGYANELKAFETHSGDILVSCAGTIGEMYELPSNSEPGVINQALMRIRVYEAVVSKKLYKLLFSNMIEDFSKEHSNGSAMKNIPPFADLKPMTAMVPSVDEQELIGAFFTQLNNLITLHQRKLLKLKNVKKAMLEKMFPKNGSTVPEIRFAGFTDAWEQRKVSTVCEIVAGGTPSTNQESYWNPKEVPWLSSGEVHNKRIRNTDDMISQKGLDNSSAKWVKEKSILIALAGQGKTRGTVAVNEIPLTTNQSIAAMIPQKSVHYEFILSNLEARYEEIRMLSSADGSRGGLNKQMIGDILIPYTSMGEQKKIGSYFRELDNLITLHQRKYEKLQNLKKACLEKMFV